MPLYLKQQPLTLGTKGGVDAPFTPTEIAVTLLRLSIGIMDRVIPGTSR